MHSETVNMDKCEKRVGREKPGGKNARIEINEDHEKKDGKNITKLNQVAGSI